jgi:integrase/recombinase XerD
MLVVSGVGFEGPLVPLAEAFAAELRRLGYAEEVVKIKLRVVAHLSSWLLSEGWSVRDLGAGEVISAFVAAHRFEGRKRRVTLQALAPLITFLSRLGRVSVPVPVAPSSPFEVLLARYRSFLLNERGFVSSGAARSAGVARSFLSQRVDELGEVDVAGLSAADVSAFVLRVSKERGRSPACEIVKRLRTLLRFLHGEGLTASSLAAAVPKVASWRLAGLPQALPADDVARLFAACDSNRRAGRRDLAILMLLVRLGLRSCEVAQLELDDVDWRAGELVIRGKGNRWERLPLPVDVGEVLVDYLRFGRPSTALDRRFFIRDHAPHRGLTAGTVGYVVFAAGQRAGLDRPVRAHRLRHSAATNLVAAGAGLVEVGQVLRHRDQLTTAIYAKVDRSALRILARPWPVIVP